MIYFEDSRVVNFEDLRQVVDEDGNRIYSERLLQGIESGNLNCLNEVELTDRNNKFFMEPLLYAVKNSELSTYEVYKYYGEELQKSDLTMATEIVINEPDVLEDTAIADDPTSVLYLAKINPEIVLYMSEDLKSNGQFIGELSELNNKEVMSYVAQECDISEVIGQNPELANNADFMKEAIKNDSSAILFASEKLKNDYEFIKQACKGNSEVIDEIVEHKEEFSAKGLTAAKDALGENTADTANTDFKEELEKLEESTQVTDEQEQEKLERRKAQVTRHIATLDAVISGEREISAKEARRILRFCKDLDPKYIVPLNQIIDLEEAALAKQKVEQENEANVEEQEEQENNVTPKKIENLTLEYGAKTSDLNNQAGTIRNTIERSQPMQQQEAPTI